MEQGRDRRQYPRLEGHFRVDLLNMGDDPHISPWEAVVEASALDISMKGLRVKSHYNVTLRTMLSVMVYYRGRESICLCEVVWKREVMGEFVYGLFFKDWSNLDKILEKKLSTMQTDETDTIENHNLNIPASS